MNSIIVMFEAPGMTAAVYDSLMHELEAGGGLPNKNLLSHVAFQKGDSWCAVDVWRSQEAFMDFGQNALFPIFEKKGITPPQPQIFPVHNYIGATAEDVMHA